MFSEISTKAEQVLKGFKSSPDLDPPDRKILPMYDHEFSKHHITVKRGVSDVEDKKSKP